MTSLDAPCSQERPCRRGYTSGSHPPPGAQEGLRTSSHRKLATLAQALPDSLATRLWPLAADLGFGCAARRASTLDQVIAANGYSGTAATAAGAEARAAEAAAEAPAVDPPAATPY